MSHINKIYNYESLDENTKNAIAQIVIALINADGVIDESEIDNVELLKKKYHLSKANMLNANTLSFADAINKIKSANWKYSGISAGEFCNDIIALAGVDNNISHNEAMICLALHYALDEPEAHVFSYAEQSLHFAKKEVLYIEADVNEESIKFNNEINEFYNNIVSILGYYGFEFIYIPHINDDFKAIGEMYLKNIIGYLNPNIGEDEKTVEQLWNCLSKKRTVDFSRQIMAEGAGIHEFRPSLLFKISNSKVNFKGKTNISSKYINFLQVPIQPGDQVQNTIQNFMRKYVEQVKEITCTSIISVGKKFHLRGFHKTIFDFYMSIDNEVSDIVFIIDANKQGGSVKIGPKNKIKLSAIEMSLYLLFIYLTRSINKGLLVNKANFKDKLSREQQLNIYRVILAETSKSKFDEVADLYSSLTKRYPKVGNKIKQMQQTLKHWELYIPYYAKDENRYYIRFFEPVFVTYLRSNTDSGGITVKIPLSDWILRIFAKRNMKI